MRKLLPVMFSVFFLIGNGIEMIGHGVEGVGKGIAVAGQAVAGVSNVKIAKAAWTVLKQAPKAALVLVK